MLPLDRDARLSRISTVWSLVRQMHGDAADPAVAAQRMLMERYSGAAYRYLLGALRDPDVADELFQEFALRFVRGAFRRADPSRGRFRNFVKTALINLVIDYQKRKRTAPRPLPDWAAEQAGPESSPVSPDEQFEQSWREELLARAWGALEQAQLRSGQPLHTVLRFRTENPKVSSDEMAAALNDRLEPDRPYSAARARKTLQRARERFADLLIGEVAHYLENPTRLELEQELIDLELLPYCRSSLDRRFQ